MIVIDIELYSNYFLFSALEIESGRILHIDALNNEPIDWHKINRVMCKHTSISFNGLGFDLPIMALGLNGATTAKLKTYADQLIKEDLPVWQLLRKADVQIPNAWDHIDIMPVAPGQSGLKIYGGRLGMPTLQDLPIEPDAVITEQQRQDLRDYCENDLQTTLALYRALIKQIELRQSMSEQYGIDLRSKSDAQIAEYVLKSELTKLTGKTYKAPVLPKGYNFRYRVPDFIQFQTPVLQSVLARIAETDFNLSASGAVEMPEWLKKELIRVNGTPYQMGIGGLHSCEKKQFVKCAEGYCLADFDVASYYPSIIIGQGLYPKNLGPDFLKVYESIVDRRVESKRKVRELSKKIDALKGQLEAQIAELEKERAYHTVIMNSLKLTINGSFGKFGSKYSALYSPDLLIQTTITGQLALLMLIEQMELAGVRVVSANTDGVVLYYPEHLDDEVNAINFDWQLATLYELERTDYTTLASRDVNNYIAVKPSGSVKGKGVFAEPSLSKNPETPIVFEAVRQYIAKGTPVQDTIAACKDPAAFASVRQVNGGGVWGDQYLGKAVRFYYALQGGEPITYRKNGNKVPKTDSAKPLMTLGEHPPADIDYQVYNGLAASLIKDLGAN